MMPAAAHGIMQLRQSSVSNASKAKVSKDPQDAALQVTVPKWKPCTLSPCQKEADILKSAPIMHMNKTKSYCLDR